MYPDGCLLLVDTYNTLKSGIPNAIRAFNNVLKPLGITKCGIRLDSGDMAYLTKQARKMLDEAGWTECAITVSNSLDERLISELLRQGANIDSFGVGERLITSKSTPVFGGVYKLAAVERDDGSILPKIKVSENIGKITNPGFKKIYRFFNRENGMAEADYICMADEVVDDTQPLVISDPVARWKKKTMENFQAVELLKPIFVKGELVYELPTLKDIRTNCGYQVSTLWPEVKRFDNPHNYYVDLSPELMELKDRMLHEAGKYDKEAGVSRHRLLYIKFGFIICYDVVLFVRQAAYILGSQMVINIVRRILFIYDHIFFYSVHGVIVSEHPF